MFLAVALTLVLHASTAVSGAVQTVLAAEQHSSPRCDVPAAFDPVISILETRGPYYLENYSSELYLAHSPTNPVDDVDYPVRALAFTSAGASALQWYISDHSTPSGRLFSFHTNLTTELGIFVDENSGNTLTVGTRATQFNLTWTKPITYRITLPPTTLALTAPGTAGSPVTLQEIDEGSLALAQSWHVYDVPST